MENEKHIYPDYKKLHIWESYSEELLTEYRQSEEEGKDIGQYKELFNAASKMPQGKAKDDIADVLFNLVLNAPQRADYAYNEPSDLEGIKALRDNYEYKFGEINNLESRISGAWTGRICGCLLGKPIEGIRTDELNIILKSSDNYPMKRYIRSDDITNEMYESFKFDLRGKCFADTVTYAPSDDDTNYTAMSAYLIDRYGRDFTPYDVLTMWVDSQPKFAYCTAERVAFCNFVKGYCPPDSAMYKNPYREWIGAQIRGDYFGYINPGNPEKAAEMAFSDASVSHIKNGIYGEMFISAMIAYAAVCDDIEEIIKGGLAQIPAASRLYEEIMRIIAEFNNGKTFDECMEIVHKKYDENNSHDWCHTIPNAMIVSASLLYGNGGYGKSICMAVQSGFDTDCNGATVGSVLGMRNGIESIGTEWTAPINGELDTSIFNVGKVKISDMVKKTLSHLGFE